MGARSHEKQLEEEKMCLIKEREGRKYQGCLCQWPTHWQYELRVMLLVTLIDINTQTEMTPSRRMIVPLALALVIIIIAEIQVAPFQNTVTVST